MNKFLLKLMNAAGEEGTQDGMPGGAFDPDVQEFEDMLQGIEDAQNGEEGPADEPADKPAEDVPAEAEPAPAAEPEVEPEPEPEPEVPEVPTPPQQPEQPPEVDPEVAEQQRQQFLSGVQESFAISPDDANLLMTEPEAVLPKLGAMVYERAMRDVAYLMQQQQQLFQQNMPQMIQHTQQQVTQHAAAETQFKTLNPGLESVGNLNELVGSLAPTVIKANPGKSGDELMRIVGDMIYPMVGKQRAAAKAPEVPKQKPHVPVATSTPSSSPAAGVPEGEDPIVTELINMFGDN